MNRRLKPFLPGICLALSAIALGFGLGILFGSFEDAIKDRLEARAEAVLQTVYRGDEPRMKKVVRKSWRYLLRAHLHGAVLGATAIVLMLLMAASGAEGLPAKTVAVLLGGGALFYGVFWLAAGLRAPGMGSSHAAKASLAFLAIPAAGALFIGLIGAGIVCVKAIAASSGSES